jgi:abortive infection bacteriophage resistance protein
VKYTKPPLAIDEQLDLLISRGMVIPDRARASRYLSHISYFRLRGYWIPFEKKGNGPGHVFQDGTTFDAVLDLYVFDRKFRLLVLEAIERVEVSFRAHFANELGVRYGSHFYLDGAYFRSAFTHKKLIDSLQEEINRSKETFIEHYRNTYDQPPSPPIWATSEVMSFGQLSTWYKNIKARSDRNLIAKIYGVDETILQSFMHHLTFIRNITAHHGRLWNRRMTITMTMPKRPAALAAMLNPAADRYVGNTVIVLGYFLKLISPGTSWPERMRQLIESSPSIKPAAMGFRESWQDLPLWSGTR